MTTPRFLEYEIALLLAKYGKSAVLKVLAQKINCSEAELEVLLTAIEKQKKTPHHKPATLASDQLETVVSQHPEKSVQLRALYARFQNRTFLPELRDVRRFFEQHSENLGHTKSRAASLPKLLMLLVELKPAELDELYKARELGEYSSLGIISDEILRHDK